MPPAEMPEFQELQKASEGLIYPSESDEPFEVLHWPASASATAAEEVAAHGGKDRTVEEVPVDAFFSALADSDDAERFAELRRGLESRLSGLKIFRVGAGEVEVDLYLIGRAQAGDWVGLRTMSVET